MRSASPNPWFAADGMTVWNLDARRLPDVVEPGSCHAIVTDPPYGLRMDAASGSSVWDTGAVVFDTRFWRGMLDLVSPGGFLFAFGSPRTWHRLACAIEDAGWQLRGQVCWLYAQGMPKGEWADHAVDRALGYGDDRGRAAKSAGTFARRADREGAYVPQSVEARRFSGLNPSLKPAWEPILIARKPCEGTLGENLLNHGTGCLNVGAACLDADMSELRERYRLNRLPTRGSRSGRTFSPSADGDARPDGPRLDGRYPSDVACDDLLAAMVGGSSDAPVFYYHAKATGLDRPVIDHVRMVGPGGKEWKTACERSGLRVDAESYPATVFHGGPPAGATDLGGVSLSHPTVKPVDLMRWLVRLACPPDGRVLDPFLGSGTTMLACRMEGLSCVGAEWDPMFLPLIGRRLATPAQTTLFGWDSDTHGR